MVTIVATTISTWEKLGKPKKFNLVELGPGDGSLTKVLIETFKKFPLFESSTKIFLYEKSKFLKKVQKENINNDKITWIDNFDKIKQGPIIFFGNEFFDTNKTVFKTKIFKKDVI